MTVKTQNKIKNTKKKSREMASMKRQQTFKEYLLQVRKDVFECAFDPDICGMGTITELANAAGMSITAVHNLYHGITREPRHSTIFKLCKAVGADLTIVREGLSAAVPD